jgi:hypothetical protein
MTTWPGLPWTSSETVGFDAAEVSLTHNLLPAAFDYQFGSLNDKKDPLRDAFRMLE